jgi:hypothetical protein
MALTPRGGECRATAEHRVAAACNRTDVDEISAKLVASKTPASGKGTVGRACVTLRQCPQRAVPGSRCGSMLVMVRL